MALQGWCMSDDGNNVVAHALATALATAAVGVHWAMASGIVSKQTSCKWNKRHYQQAMQGLFWKQHCCTVVVVVVAVFQQKWLPALIDILCIKIPMVATPNASSRRAAIQRKNSCLIGSSIASAGVVMLGIKGNERPTIKLQWSWAEANWQPQ